MIGISRLLVEKEELSDNLRYGRPGHWGETPSAARKPIVVYNCVQSCNLHCLHCYAYSGGEESSALLSTSEARAMIASVAEFGSPVMLFSGGEPLLRSDLFELMSLAAERGLHPTLSTNGTLINRETGEELKKCGLGYVGISLDGLEDTHDRFRRSPDSWRKALAGVEHCQNAGLRTGLRVTLTRFNYHETAALFDLVRERGIERLCFYHLVYTGRGADLMAADLDPAQTRQVMEIIISRTIELHDQGYNKEILTVDNHADGPYLWLWAQKHRPALAPRIAALIQANRARSSGEGIACISWNGDVLPDQFWRDKILGNIRFHSFESIWENPENAFLRDLRRREALVGGKCRRCRFLSVCRGGFRARAEARFGDLWAEDPACYLTEEEIQGDPL